MPKIGQNRDYQNEKERIRKKIRIKYIQEQWNQNACKIQKDKERKKNDKELTKEKYKVILND